MEADYDPRHLKYSCTLDCSWPNLSRCKGFSAHRLWTAGQAASQVISKMLSEAIGWWLRKRDPDCSRQDLTNYHRIIDKIDGCRQYLRDCQERPELEKTPTSAHCREKFQTGPSKPAHVRFADVAKASIMMKSLSTIGRLQIVSCPPGLPSISLLFLKKVILWLLCTVQMMWATIV